MHLYRDAKDLWGLWTFLLKFAECAAFRSMEIIKKFHVKKEKKVLAWKLRHSRIRQKTLYKWESFLLNCTIPETKTFLFCVIFFEPIKIQTTLAPQNDCLNFTSVKYIYVVGENIDRISRKTAIYQSQILRISLYIEK